MRNHYHFPFFSQRLGAHMIATCTCGAQRRQIGPNVYAWRLPISTRQKAA